MKKFLCLIPLLLSLVFAAPVPEELLDVLHLPKDTSVAEIQGFWKQQGKERWNFDERHEELRDELTPIFQNMGYLDEIFPQKQQYKYALINGATTARVKARVASLKKAMDQGIVFDQVVCLTGMRALEEWEKAELPSAIEWEWQMVEWAVQQAGIEGALVVNAPAPPHQTRPSTIHTIQAWLATNPTPGDCLAFSNQPYIPYQNAVTQRCLPDGFFVETVGESAGDNWTVAIVLDTIARTLDYAK